MVVELVYSRMPSMLRTPLAATASAHLGQRSSARVSSTRTLWAGLESTSRSGPSPNSSWTRSSSATIGSVAATVSTWLRLWTKMTPAYAQTTAFMAYSSTRSTVSSRVGSSCRDSAIEAKSSASRLVTRPRRSTTLRWEARCDYTHEQTLAGPGGDAVSLGTTPFRARG